MPTLTQHAVTIFKAAGRTLWENAGTIAQTMALPAVSERLPFAQPARGQAKLAGLRLLTSKTVDGAVIGGASNEAWAKYAIRKGLPETETERRIAIENEPHEVDDFNGTIESGYGKGTKKLLYSGIGVVEINGKKQLSKINYHEHDAEKAGLHYDLVAESVPQGVSRFTIHIPNGPVKGRYLVTRTIFGERKTAIGPNGISRVLPEELQNYRSIAFLRGTSIGRDGSKLILTKNPYRSIMRLPDEGLVLPKPDYRLKDESFLDSIADTIQDWIVETKYDGSLVNVNISRGFATFRSHRDGGETYYDRLPALDSLKNTSRLLTCRLLFPYPSTGNTVLKGELVHKNGVAAMGGILNSNPARAQQYQAENGPAEFYAWDIVRYRGRDVSKQTYARRRELLEQVMAEVRPFNRNWKIAERLSGDPRQAYQRVIERGLPYGEGVILKPKNSVDGWLKVKASLTADLDLISIGEGQGKYAGSAGFLRVRGESGEIGEIGSFAVPDGYRQWLWDNRGQLEGQAVVNIKAMAMTSERMVPRAGVFTGIHLSKSDPAAAQLAAAYSLEAE